MLRADAATYLGKVLVDERLDASDDFLVIARSGGVEVQIACKRK